MTVREDETVHPRLTARVERARSLPVLVWQFAEPRLCISSGPLGGGIGVRGWVVNATVPLDYDRTDPDRHLIEIAAGFELIGTGCGLLTAVDVSRYHVAADTGVVAAATVGLSHPTWAAAPDRHFRGELPSGAGTAGFADFQTVEYRPLIAGDEHRVGTINIVVAVPVRLSEAARQRRGHCHGGESAGVVRGRGAGHRNSLGRDRRALPDGRNSGNLRWAALGVRRPDRASGARGCACRCPGLDFRSARPALHLGYVRTRLRAEGIEVGADAGCGRETGYAGGLIGFGWPNCY